MAVISKIEPTAWAETGRVIAHPWLCDVNGHLNTRHFQGFFDDAAQHLYACCGFLGAAATGPGVADIGCSMEYRAEVPPGALLLVQSCFEKLGRTSMISYHELLSADRAKLHATCSVTTVFFDLAARASIPMTAAFREAASRYLVRSDPEGDGTGLTARAHL